MKRRMWVAVAACSLSLAIPGAAAAAPFPDFAAEKVPLGLGGGFTAIDAISPDSVWAVGSEWGGGADSFGFVVRRTAGRWQRVDPPCINASDWTSIDDISNSSIWVTGYFLSSDGGDDGTSVAHYDTGTWQCWFFPNLFSQTVTVQAHKGSVWVSGLSRAGDHYFLHWNGTSWEQFGPTTKVRVMGGTATTVYAGGLNHLGGLQIWVR